MVGYIYESVGIDAYDMWGYNFLVMLIDMNANWHA